MTREFQMPNAECRMKIRRPFCHSSFVLRHSLVIRASSLGISPEQTKNGKLLVSAWPPITKLLNTTCWSSARAARACARPSKRRRPASRSASSANRCSARRTLSWPRAAWRRRWATWTTATTGRCTSPTRCAAANTSTTGAWPNCTRRKRRRAFTNSKRGARCLTARKDGKILQRNFGGHRYPRLAHVGDRTGLELIRTLQDHGIHQGITVHMEYTIVSLLKDGEPRRRRVRLRPRARAFQDFQGEGRGACHRRSGPRVQNHQQFLGMHRRRRFARLSRRRGIAGHGIHPIPSDRHDLAAERARACS